jgi:hypothetical protein
MNVAIDTHVLIGAFKDWDMECVKTVSIIIEEDRLVKLCLDRECVIEQEYKDRVGSLEGFRKWYQCLFQNHAFLYNTGKFSNEHRDKLVAKGCHRISDHAFIGVAFNSDKVLISGNSAVGKDSKESKHLYCDVLEYLTEVMRINVFNAKEFCELQARISESEVERLHKFFNDHFNKGELKTFCMDFEVDYEEIEAENKSGTIRELILYCKRHDRLLDLMKKARKERPNAPW